MQYPKLTDMMDEARYSMYVLSVDILKKVFNTVGAPHMAVTSFESGGFAPALEQ